MADRIVELEELALAERATVMRQAEELTRLRAILAALREPSDAVIEAGCVSRFGPHNWAKDDHGEGDWRKAQRTLFGWQLVAAVAAAEQEVDRD